MSQTALKMTVFPLVADERYDESQSTRCQFNKIEQWLCSAQAQTMSLGEVELAEETKGRELLRLMLQDHVDKRGVGDVGPMMSMKDYLGLSIKILVFLGMVFQFPNIIFILGLLKIVTPQKLSGIRTHIYVALAILSAFFTPPDILTMLGLWLPLVLLFEIGVLGVRFFIRR